MKVDDVMEQERARCVGKRGVSRCTNISPNYPSLPPYPEHPTWPYLCPTCANEAPRSKKDNSNGIVLERPKNS